MFTTQEQAEELKTIYESLKTIGKIEMHCQKHGYIRGFRDFSVADQNKIVRAIRYFNGEKSVWADKRDLEFAYNGFNDKKRRPWSWCGVSVIFPDWQAQEERNDILRARFSIGNKVWFDNKGERYYGVVSHVGKRITVIITSGNSGPKWYVSPGNLHKENE